MQTPYTYGPAMLTSLERVAFYLNKDIGLGRVDGRNNDTDEQRRTRQALMGWILDVSAQIQYHCNREFLIQPRTQYFDNIQAVQEFFPSAVPILSVAALEWDFSGTWEVGAESVIDATAYQIGPTGNTFRMRYGTYQGMNALRLNTYLGGLAYHATQSVMTLGTVTGAGNIAAGRYAYGMDSESIGRVVAFDSGTGAATIDTLSGSFRALEELTFQPTAYGQDIASTGATIASIDRQSLADAHPEIARAVEIEIRFLEKHEYDFEIQSDGSAKSGASRRQPRGKDARPSGLQEETEARLWPYVRHLVGS